MAELTFGHPLEISLYCLHSLTWEPIAQAQHQHTKKIDTYEATSCGVSQNLYSFALFLSYLFDFIHFFLVAATDRSRANVPRLTSIQTDHGTSLRAGLLKMGIVSIAQPVMTEHEP